MKYNIILLLALIFLSFNSSNNLYLLHPAENPVPTPRTLTGSLSENPERAASACHIEEARRLEKEGEFRSALSHWERVIDTCFAEATDEELLEARRALARLNEKVPPSTQPSEANSMRLYVLLFTEVDFSWQEEGKSHHVQFKLSPREIENVKAGFYQFKQKVFEYSLGAFKIDETFVLADRPLKSLAPMGKAFWIGPETIEPNMGRKLFEPGEYDGMIAYAPMQKGGQEIPAAIGGGALGCDAGYQRIEYNGLQIFQNDLVGVRTGELELHEWLHLIDHTLRAHAGYPARIVPSSDDGREESQSGGDLDYRRPKNVNTWFPFYKHIMQEHFTHQMWHEVKWKKPEGPFIENWRIQGPFENKDDKGLDVSFIDETKESLDISSWKKAKGKIVNFKQYFSRKEQAVAYAAVTVTVEQPIWAKLWIGSDDGVKVWLNGYNILFNHSHRALSEDQDCIRVLLKKGLNFILFKVDQGDGEWGLCARITSLSNEPLKIE
ncbi:MAG: hypothetical protein V1871_05775 [Planctomycetota bacterium]